MYGMLGLVSQLRKSVVSFRDGEAARFSILSGFLNPIWCRATAYA